MNTSIDRYEHMERSIRVNLMHVFTQDIARFSIDKPMIINEHSGALSHNKEVVGTKKEKEDVMYVMTEGIYNDCTKYFIK